MSINDLSDFIIDDIAYHLDVKSIILFWIASQKKVLSNKITNIIHISSNNIPYEQCTYMIHMRKRLISKLQSEMSILKKRRHKLREDRLIKIPFKNYVLLRYWKHYNIQKIDDIHTLSDILRQCAFLQGLIDDTDIEDFIDQYDHYHNTSGLIKHLTKKGHMPKTFNFYHYGCNDHDWYSCREYLPIRDTYFVSYYTMTHQKRKQRKEKVRLLHDNHFDMFKADVTQCDIYEMDTHTYIRKEKCPKTIIVDPYDYPLDRRHLLTVKNLDPQSVINLPHFEPCPNYDADNDYVSIVVDDNSEIITRRDLKKIIHSGKYHFNAFRTLSVTRKDNNDPITDLFFSFDEI